jgi:flavin reductase (DIM6/NTAB) family NADH-FMN oxidoreductase RutF
VVSTIGADASVNLAPYSFFNAVAEAPPMLAFSSHGVKDSATFADEGAIAGQAVDTAALRPVARCGGPADYAVVDRLFQMSRPEF